MVARNRSRAGAVIVLVAVLAVTTYALVSRSSSSTPTGARTTSTCPSYSTNTITTNSVTISGASGGAAIQVVSDLGAPMAGVVIHGETLEQCEVTAVWSSTTNSTGWIYRADPIGAYSLTVSYQGDNFTAAAPLYPISLTMVKIQVPSGLWTVEVRDGFTFQGFPYAGPSYVSSGAGSPRMNVTLASSSVGQGDFLPFEVSFEGPGASGASYGWVTLAVTNSQGTVVGNFSQRIPDLYFLSAAANLRGFASYDGWNAHTHPPDFNVPVTPGTYTLTVSTFINGRVLTASGPFQVTT